MPRYLSDEYNASDERVERQPHEELLKDEKAGAARQRSKKEVTDLLKADKEARKDARNEAKEASPLIISISWAIFLSFRLIF